MYRNEVLFLFTKPLIMVMGDPLNNSFIFTHLIEAFAAQLESCLILSFILSFLPLLIIHLFLYIIPGLFLYERKFLIFFLFGTLGFLSFGFIIGYNYIVPFAWKFLLGFQLLPESNPFSVVLEARIKDYIDLIVNLTYLIVFVFQIPFLIILGLFFNLFTIQFCTKHRRYILLSCWVIAALVTPPDVLSQICIAIPLFFIIELTFFIFFCCFDQQNF
jgi:sec-independent protein translocase protein TatC